jgi:hypothetical protein
MIHAQPGRKMCRGKAEVYLMSGPWLRLENLTLRRPQRGRREGWPRVRALRPSFETLASQAPQDEASGVLGGACHRAC